MVNQVKPLAGTNLWTQGKGGGGVGARRGGRQGGLVGVHVTCHKALCCKLMVAVLLCVCV